MMHFLPALLLQAPAPAPAPTGGPSSTVFVIQMVVIFGIFYLLVMRPQRKQQKLLEQSVMNMSKGDEVRTAGGIIGEVVHMSATLKDGVPTPTMADRITIRSGDAKLVIERSKIVRVSGPNAG